MASVRLEGVRKIYPSARPAVTAIDDLSLMVADGEFVALVGPSGCGKTTVLRLIAGLEDLTAGTVHIADRMVNQVAPKGRDVAMVFQHHALYPHMTVFNNMGFGLRMRRVAKVQIRQQVLATARLLGIEDLLDRRPGQLSGGQGQRVALGRAIVRRPKAFLFDEPLSSLDPQLRVQMRTELKQLHRRLGATVIHVTHDQEEAMALGDRVAVLKEGRLQQCGRPLELYQRPNNRFVAQFIGTPAMNFFEGRLVVRQGQAVFEAGFVSIPLPRLEAARAARYDGQALSLGVRPTDLWLGNGQQDAAHPAHSVSRTNPVGRTEPVSRAGPMGRWLMQVTMIEPLGQNTDVHLQQAAGPKLMARVPSATVVSEGSMVQVTLDGAKAHVFEPGETGLNIGLERSVGAAPRAH